MPGEQRPRGDMQARILAYIQEVIDTRGYPPSVREIGEAVGLRSTSTVHGHLTRLEKKGLLHRDAMKPRAMGHMPERLTTAAYASFLSSAALPPVSPSSQKKASMNRWYSLWIWLAKANTLSFASVATA